jgi:hypothetical protein
LPAGYTALSPKRVLDTRIGVGAPKAKVGARRTITLSIPGLPVGTTAVTMNVTATNPTSTSYVSVYPAGTTRASASNLNVVRGPDPEAHRHVDRQGRGHVSSAGEPGDP